MAFSSTSRCTTYYHVLRPESKKVKGNTGNGEMKCRTRWEKHFPLHEQVYPTYISGQNKGKFHSRERRAATIYFVFIYGFYRVRSVLLKRHTISSRGQYCKTSSSDLSSRGRPENDLRMMAETVCFMLHRGLSLLNGEAHEYKAT